MFTGLVQMVGQAQRSRAPIQRLADVVAGIGFVFAHQGFVFRQNLLIVLAAGRLERQQLAEARDEVREEDRHQVDQAIGKIDIEVQARVCAQEFVDRRRPPRAPAIARVQVPELVPALSPWC